MKLTCLMAQTLDGKIGRDAAHFPDWTEPADKKLFVHRTKQSGVMIFGRTTFETLPGKLPGRMHVVMSRSAGEWEEKEPNVIFTKKNPRKILEKLAELGFDDVILAGGMTVNGLFATEKLIDELIITISPIIFGEGLGVFPPDVSLDLELQSFEPLGERSAVAIYTVKK